MPVDDGVTVTELVERTGANDKAVRRQIVALLKAGKAQAVRVRRQRMDGMWTLVSAYRLL